MTLTLDDYCTNTNNDPTPEPITPSKPRLGKWTVDPDQRTKKDWTPYLSEKLVVSLELEYNFKNGVETVVTNELGREVDRHNTFDPVSETEVGVHEGEHSRCPVCGSSGCWKCDLPKTIRIVKPDCTIHGREFIVIGSSIPSEEFVKRLPIENIKKYFESDKEDSMHSHILIPGNSEEIPVSIGQNTWQLFRAYYPAWAYIFGNFKGHILRGYWAVWNDYHYDATDFDYWWNGDDDSGSSHDIIVNTPRPIARRYKHGLTFASCHVNGFNEKVFTHFDVEIRQTDASQDLEQIVSARALSKALVLKGAQLANHGVIDIPEDRWETIKPVIEDINRSQGVRSSIDSTLERRQGKTMRAMAKDFYREMADLLTPYEQHCVRHCIESPVRKRHPNVKRDYSN